MAKQKIEIGNVWNILMLNFLVLSFPYPKMNKVFVKVLSTSWSIEWLSDSRRQWVRSLKLASKAAMFEK